MSNCLPCRDTPAPCACKKGESCIMTVKQCQQCPKNVCVANPGSGSGINTGVTVGGALGGVAGVAIALGLLYLFWWKPRGLAASRKRYSRHLEARQSKRLSQLQPQNSTGGGGGNATKRTSVHLPMDVDTLSSRHSRAANMSDDDHAPSSTGATHGGTLPRIRESFDSSDNPFSDNLRHSIPDGASARISEFSFRSSHSTNIIPIAYIPPHSASMSLDDAIRDAYGGLPSPTAQTAREAPKSAQRASVPASLASRDSLVINGSDLIDLHPLPPALSPDSLKTGPAPSSSSSPTQAAAPTRPPRAPGLDLSLPKKRASVTSPLGASAFAGARPLSGFPWSAPETSKPVLVSKFSSDNSGFSPSESSALSTGLTLGPLGPTSAPAANGKEQAHLSVMSTMTTSSSRSGSSTMSYILDPPQIITPVNPQGVRRVEMLGRGQAGLVRLPTTTALSRSAAATASSDDPFSDAQAIKARPDSTRRFTTSSLPASAHDSVTSLPLQPADASRWSEFSSSAVDNSDNRKSTQSLAISLTADPARASFASTATDATESASMLDGIPFLPPSASPTSPVGTVRDSSASLALPDAATNADRASFGPVDEDEDADLDPSSSSRDLQAPFLPFADHTNTNQPASANQESAARDSTAMSVRSGFGSGLSQIPFQLGFPSGFDAQSLMGDDDDDAMSARNSVNSTAGFNDHASNSNRGSIASSFAPGGPLSESTSQSTITPHRNSGAVRQSRLTNVVEGDAEDEPKDPCDDDEDEGEKDDRARESWMTGSSTGSSSSGVEHATVVTTATRHKMSPSVSTLKALSRVDEGSAAQTEQAHDEDDPFKDA